MPISYPKKTKKPTTTTGTNPLKAWWEKFKQSGPFNFTPTPQQQIKQQFYKGPGSGGQSKIDLYARNAYYTKVSQNPELLKTNAYKYQGKTPAYYSQTNPYYPPYKSSYDRYAQNPELLKLKRYKNQTSYQLKIRTPGIVSGYPIPEGYAMPPGVEQAGGGGGYGSGYGRGRGGYGRGGGGGGSYPGYSGYSGSPDYPVQTRAPTMPYIDRWIQNMMNWRFSG